MKDLDLMSGAYLPRPLCDYYVLSANIFHALYREAARRIKSFHYQFRFLLKLEILEHAH
jgi:hypothetical protein